MVIQIIITVIIKPMNFLNRLKLVTIIQIIQFTIIMAIIIKQVITIIIKQVIQN